MLRRMVLRFALAMPILVYVAASSPSIAQRTPRFLLPALAAIGGVLLVFSFVNSLVHLERLYRRERRVRLLPAAVSGIATLLLVVLPLTHLVRAMRAPAVGPPLILAGFGDWLGSEGYPRPSPHRGLDIAGRIGADVLAAAGGHVTVARDTHDLCGLIIVIEHDPYGYRTIYCHFSEIAVQAGDTVERAQRIGALGASGQRAWPGFQHVHLELQRGRNSSDLEDPLSRIVGCFDATKLYPADRLVLTYPVKC